MAAETPRSIRASIYIDGRPAVGTLTDLRQNTQQLRREMDRLTVGTDEYNRKMRQLQAGERQLQRIKDEIKGVGGAFGWLKTEIGKLGMLATGFLGLQFITQQFQNIIVQNAKLSDSLADIRKTTGMSEASVRHLQQSFKEIDTRSSRAELNSLAEVAGKLGISSQRDVLGFVKAADQINVALGKDLGNAEQAINDLGKLTEIFQIKDQYGLEQALLKTGSAINGLGAAGTANEGYIVEFTKRLGGIAPQAKISIQDVMGLASVMDELGQPVEASATAIGQFIMSLGNDTAKMANIAGMTKKAFEELLSKDGMAALKAVLTNLKTSGEGVQSLAENMGMVGEDGARATAALGVLSNNLGLLSTRQAQSNKLFEEGTSLTEEFNVKNANFGASLDRLSKKFNQLTSNSNLTDFLTGFVVWLSKAIETMNKWAGTFLTMIKVITVGGAAWLTYSTYVGLASSSYLKFIVAMVTGQNVMALNRTATLALATVQALLAGNMDRARRTATLFNMSLAANPIGIVVAAIVAAVAAFAVFGDSVSEAQRIEQNFNKINAEAEKSIIREKTALEQALKAVKERSKSKAEEAAAIQRLRDLMPDHLKGYTDEEIKAGKATNAVYKHIEALEREARAKAATNRMTTLQEEIIDIQMQTRKGYDGLSSWEKMKTGLAMTAKHGALTPSGVKEAYFKELREERDMKEKEIKEIMAMYGSDMLSAGAPKLNLEVPAATPGAFNLAEATKDQLQQQLAKDAKALDQLKRGTEEYNKVATEMVAIRKRLKEIAKDTGVGGNGGETDQKKALERYKQLQKEVKELQNKVSEDAMSANALEIRNAEKKYDALIVKEREFLAMKGTNGQQRAQAEKNIADLEAAKWADVNNIKIRQEEEYGQKVKELRAALSQVYDTELQQETNRINKFYDEQANKAESYEDWYQVEVDREADLTDAKIRERRRWEDYVKEIRQQGVVASASEHKVELARINKFYDDQIEALKKKFGIEKALTADQQADIDLINGNRKAETKKLELKESKTKLDYGIQQAETLMNAVFQIGNNNRQAETDAELKSLDERRERELSNKSLNEEQKKRIQDKYDKEAAAIKLKAWEADKSASMQSAVIAGALSVVKALPNIPLAIASGVAAAAQIAVIAATKPPKFAEGGFSDEDPAGYVNQATVFRRSASGRPFMAGEAGREWIAPNWMLRNPRTANLIGVLEAERQGKRAFAAGGYNGANPNGTTYAADPEMIRQNQLLEQQNNLLLEMASGFDKFAKKPFEFPMRVYNEKQKQHADLQSRVNS